ncbi:hypothetical protein [Streptomyces sp. SID2888]|uniref:hypothetical protein n=1 Tax=Streptomyces sp. SID2888 TaxID=2690256 RepID=UPI0013680829|nr:hypothetical protein [Streptomyces sp. SID2888]MYV44288.1 hypothetical protein [Streptomyces sp. SID2888]
MRDGLGFLLDVPVFVGTQTSPQSAVNGWTAISLNTTQVDTYGGHSNTVNNSRYTAQVAGYYNVCGVACWATNGTNVRAARIDVNGTVVQGTSQMFPASTTTITGVATPLRTVYLAVGDYVEVAGYQNSGVASPGLATGVASDVTSSLFVIWSHA